MAVSLTPQNKQTVKRLLRTGRWNNQSELFRAALHLLEKAVIEEQRANLLPIPEEQLSKALDKVTPEEKADHTRMGRASIRHRPKPEDLD